MLVKRFREKTDRMEWCLVSRKNPSKVLEWYGTKKPSEERVRETERRVQYYKHK